MVLSKMRSVRFLVILIVVLLLSQRGPLLALAFMNIQLVHDLEKLADRSPVQPLVCARNVGSEDTATYSIPVYGARAMAFHAAVSGDCRQAVALWGLGLLWALRT